MTWRRRNSSSRCWTTDPGGIPAGSALIRRHDRPTHHSRHGRLQGHWPRRRAGAGESRQPHHRHGPLGKGADQARRRDPRRHRPQRHADPARPARHERDRPPRRRPAGSLRPPRWPVRQRRRPRHARPAGEHLAVQLRRNAGDQLHRQLAPHPRRPPAAPHERSRPRALRHLRRRPAPARLLGRLRRHQGRARNHDRLLRRRDREDPHPRQPVRPRRRAHRDALQGDARRRPADPAHPAGSRRHPAALLRARASPSTASASSSPGASTSRPNLFLLSAYGFFGDFSTSRSGTPGRSNAARSSFSR